MNKMILRVVIILIVLLLLIKLVPQVNSVAREYLPASVLNLIGES